MPRQLRIQYRGALYHVTATGDRREDIVHNDGDREMLLATLAEICKQADGDRLRFHCADVAGVMCGPPLRLASSTIEILNLF